MGERKTLRLVARYADACNFFAHSVDQVAHTLDVLRRHCKAEGRDYDEIEKTILHVGAPPMSAADAGPFIEAMRPYAALGVSRVILMPAGPDPAGFVRTLAAHVVPALADLKRA
jgi:hypothetical protein